MTKIQKVIQVTKADLAEKLGLKEVEITNLMIHQDYEPHTNKPTGDPHVQITAWVEE